MPTRYIQPTAALGSAELRRSSISLDGEKAKQNYLDSYT